MQKRRASDKDLPYTSCSGTPPQCSGVSTQVLAECEQARARAKHDDELKAYVATLQAEPTRLRGEHAKLRKDFDRARRRADTICKSLGLRHALRYGRWSGTGMTVDEIWRKYERELQEDARELNMFSGALLTSGSFTMMAAGGGDM